MLAAIVFVAVIAVIYLMKMGKINKSMRQFPGPLRLPILGNMLEIGNNSKDIFDNFYKLWKKYGNNFRVFIGPTTAAVVITEPKDIEVVLSSQKLLTKGWIYQFMSPWLGNGLASNTGESWRRNRKIITPTFHFKILEQFLPIFNTQLDVLVNKLSKEATIGEAFDVFPYITLFGLDVICETAMGQHVDAQNNAEGDYVKAVHTMCKIVNLRGFNPLLMSDTLFKFSNYHKEQTGALKVLHGFVNKVINTRRKHLQDNAGNQAKDVNDVDDIGTKQRVAFLDLMLKSTDDQGNPLPHEIIRDEVHTFMFAGHDTTTITISFACYLLSLHPDIQQKAFQEQQDILGDDLTRLPDHSELQDMKYLDMLIKETLRLYPPGPYFSRTVTEDIDLRGKIIAKGCEIIVSPYIVHRNPEYFPNPEKCDPDRFLPELQSKRHPFSYIPFSAGPRNCVGMKFAQLELKATLSKLLRHFEFIPSGHTEERILAVEFTIKSMNGMPVKIKHRQYT